MSLGQFVELRGEVLWRLLYPHGSQVFVESVEVSGRSGSLVIRWLDKITSESAPTDKASTSNSITPCSSEAKPFSLNADSNWLLELLKGIQPQTHAKIFFIPSCFSYFHPSPCFLKSLPCFSNPQATFLHSFRLWRRIRSQEKGSNINSGHHPTEPLDFLREGQSILDFSPVFLINQSPWCAACKHLRGRSLLGRLAKHNLGPFAD